MSVVVAAVVAVKVAVAANVAKPEKPISRGGDRKAIPSFLSLDFCVSLQAEKELDMKKNVLFVAAAILVCMVGCKSKSVEEKLAELNEWNDTLMEQYRTRLVALDGDEDAIEAYTDSIIDVVEDYNLKAIKANLDNEVGVAALKNLYGLMDDDELSEYVDKLTAPVHGQDSAFVNGLKVALNAQKATAEGQKFTDFEVDGVKFSDFIGKGKYVLVDFWASWCGPCRGEMPNLRAVYDEFHGDKFDMLSVAVWDKPEDTKKAAEEENIVWNQIINAQQIPTDLYGIQGIPHIIFFGPDGTILKRGLRGDDIREAVAEALND